MVFPKDGQAGGTWIACSATLTVCLLNGAFKAHLPQPPYRLSRGLVVLAAFEYSDINNFMEEYSLEGIEPFTMLILSHKSNDLKLTELCWDGENRFIAQKDIKQPHIWSSVTLYTPLVIQKREGWFAQWLDKESHATIEGIRRFHHFGGEGDQAYDLKMSRSGIVSTVSITSVVCLPEQITMQYEDTRASTIITHSLSRKNMYHSSQAL
jgi:hypothetical protein